MTCGADGAGFSRMRICGTGGTTIARHSFSVNFARFDASVEHSNFAAAVSFPRAWKITAVWRESQPLSVLESPPVPAPPGKLSPPLNPLMHGDVVKAASGA